MIRRRIKFVNWVVTVFIISAAGIIFLFSITNHQRFKNYAINNLKEYGSVICRDISFTSVDYLFNKTYPSLGYIIDEYRDREAVSRISIINNERIIVADTKTDLIGSVNSYKFECNKKNGTCIENYSDEELRFIRVVEIEGITLGEVIIIISLDKTNAQLQSFKFQAILIGNMYFILCLIIGIFLGRGVSIPFKKLTMAITNLADGDYEQLVGRQWLLEMSELQNAFNRMADKLTFREKQIEEAKLEAERANSAKTIFLSNISHEFRTPLNGILGLSSMLSKTDLDDEQKFLLNKIQSSGETLTSMIRNLLDLIELESGSCKLDKKKFNIEKLLSKLKIITKMLIDKKPVQFEIELDKNCRWIIGDEERIEQILVLMLNNAAKFTLSGTIKLSVVWDGELKITVKDTGIGIPLNKQPEVFEMLQQGEKPNTKIHAGIGVGLPIVKLLVELMGGYVILESVVDKGTTITIHLPHTKCTENNVTIIKRSASENRKFNILIVEDEAINRMYLNMVLQKEGYNVDEAINGNSAIEKYNSNDYDLILMDIGLPGIDGIDTAESIFSSEKYYRNPVGIFAVTASADKETRRRCEEIGMTDFITKPVREDILFSSINSVLFME